MSDKTVPVFVEQNGTGERVQVGWATPLEGGVRRLDLYPDYKNVPKGTLRYGDEDPVEEETAEVDFSDNSEGYAAADTSYSFPAFNAPSNDEDEPLPSTPVEDAPDGELAAEPVAPGDFADEEGREDDDLDDVDEEEDFEPDEEEPEEE